MSFVSPMHLRRTSSLVNPTAGCGFQSLATFSNYDSRLSSETFGRLCNKLRNRSLGRLDVLGKRLSLLFVASGRFPLCVWANTKKRPIHHCERKSESKANPKRIRCRCVGRLMNKSIIRQSIRKHGARLCRHNLVYYCSAGGNCERFR